MKNKIIAVFLVLCVVFSMSACAQISKTDKNKASASKQEKTKSGSITLLYNKSDSLNPYTAKSENNRNICKLLFEPLVKLDNKFNPVLRVAESVNLDGKTCTVTLKNIAFSDGSKLTADDVIYSYNLAKTYGGLYSTHLYEVVSVSAVNSNTVVFNLSKVDPYFKNLLDFPIIKAKSESEITTDGVAKAPIGCGRYVKKDDENVLLQNELFFGKKGAVTSVKLIHAPDEDSISHYIEVGATDLYYSDITGANVARMSGKRCDVPLNNFVFIGMNTSLNELSNKNFRYAISSAIDRKAICKDAFFNTAQPAKGYFHPLLKDTASVQSIKTDSDLEITVENLSKIGYNNKNEDGYYVDENGKHHIFNMIVNKDSRLKVVAAKTIASQLRSAGIELTVTECSFSEYQNRLLSGSFELYLGEMSVLPNYDMSPLAVAGNSAAYGVAVPMSENQTETESENPNQQETAQNTTADIYGAYFSGTATVTDVAGTLLTEMVQIPLLYRNGILFYKDKLTNIFSSESDIYYSAEEYNIK